MRRILSSSLASSSWTRLYQAVQPVVHPSLPFLSYHLHRDILSFFSHILKLLNEPEVSSHLHSLHLFTLFFIHVLFCPLRLISLPSLLLIVFFLATCWDHKPWFALTDVLNRFCFKTQILYRMPCCFNTKIVFLIGYLSSLLSKCLLNLSGFMLSAANDSLPLLQVNLYLMVWVVFSSWY